MKKIFTFLALAAASLSSFAQATQQYLRVEFTVPITGYFIPSGQTNNSVAATMKDNYTYCNPLNDYLDFNVTDAPMGFRTTTNNVNENSTFYLENGRTTFTTPGSTAPATYPFDCDKIKKITSYSLPVETVTLIDSTETHDIVFIGNGKTYKGAEFTFNRLPRNVAELKTLIEPKGDGVRQGCDNPLYVAAVMYLIWPRLLDCSEDCRQMLNYMYGAHYDALQTVGISNQSFQNLCIGQFTDNKGKDAGGYYSHNNLFQHFGGATPGNQYKPNGEDYFTAKQYKVRVVWDPATPTQPLSSPKCTIGRIFLMPNPDATTKDEISFEDPTAHVVMVRSTNKNGWFFHSNEKTYYSKGKAQTNDDF